MLDINLFRTEKGGNPDLVRESQRRRFKDEKLVDKVIELDNVWRKAEHAKVQLKKIGNECSKIVGAKMKAKEALGDAELPDNIANCEDFTTLDSATLTSLSVAQLKELSKQVSVQSARKEKEAEEADAERLKTLLLIGNIVHESVPVSDNEDHNTIIRTVGECKVPEGVDEPLHHVDIMKRLGGMDTEKGAEIAGNRGYFLKGPLVLMQLAVVNYGMTFLTKKGFTPMYPPFFMNERMMGQVAQLEQFSEELYRVTGEGEDKFLIATAEQPICAYHHGERLDPRDLPIKYVGFSSCFRKEAGSHGKDTTGIFRVHQFDKIEQFCITTPKDNVSWDAQEEMLENAEAFYQSLGIPYRVVSIVSGALNNAAARKYDMEGYFPGAKTEKFRELVSCSNCTDYQSRRLDIRYGQTVKGGAQAGEKDYVHMLNSTLCAITRTLCVICENYQTKDGVRVPSALVPFMGGVDFLPYIVELKEEPKTEPKAKKTAEKK